MRLVAEVLWERWRVRQHDRWRADEVARHQRQRLAALRDHAAHRSAFFREHHRGLAGAPLSELPPLTKATLMARWDDLVTDPRLRLHEVADRLAELEATGGDPAKPWQGRWWLAATGGSTGLRGVFAWDRREWVQVMASYARVNDWAGVRVGPRHPLPTAIVSTRNPTHQSAVVGATLRNRMVPTLRLDSTEPLGRLVEQLNAFRPRLLVCYASMLMPLAEAQREGRLDISPEKVVTASEEQSPAARGAAVGAWGVDVVNTYAATEAATIASTCPSGSLHLYEDFVVVEPVDQAYRPVPEGELSDRLLVTVLTSRTLPLIRYELTDSVRLSTSGCDCGLPFRRLESVAGRTEDTMELPGASGHPVRVRPNVFHNALESWAVHGWQVQQLPSGIHVLVLDPDGALDLSIGAARVQDSLTAVGVAPSTVVRASRVATLERTQLGKAPLIRALRKD